MIPEGSTGATTSKLLQHNKMHKTKFSITKACNGALKEQIMASFHNDYVEVLGNTNVGFAQITTIELLNHLYGSYGTITPIEMEDTTNAMVTPYDPSKPITNFSKLEGITNQPMQQKNFTNAQISTKAYI